MDQSLYLHYCLVEHAASSRCGVQVRIPPKAPFRRLFQRTTSQASVHPNNCGSQSLLFHSRASLNSLGTYLAACEPCNDDKLELFTIEAITSANLFSQRFFAVS